MGEPELNRDVIDEITESLAAGQKIEAIKLYRNATNSGLKDAKEFIDALIPKLAEKDPERFRAIAERQQSGCGSAVLLVAVVCSALVLAVSQ